MSYWALIVTRNGEKTIRPTLKSIIGQVVRPTLLCIVDDGSTDATPNIIQEFKGKSSMKIHIIVLPDRGYDIRRVVHNINQAVAEIERLGLGTEYMLVSGDDCIYPSNYAKRILKKMDGDRSLVVASGNLVQSGESHLYLAPHGSGRFIRNSFFQRIGNRYPPYYGYETWLLFKAIHLGLKVQNFRKIRFQHLHMLGERHGFSDWGLGMKCLGYHPLEVIRRCLTDFDNGQLPPRACVRMLWDYFRPTGRKNDPYFRPHDKELREFVYKRQGSRASLLNIALLSAKSLIKLLIKVPSKVDKQERRTRNFDKRQSRCRNWLW